MNHRSSKRCQRDCSSFLSLFLFQLLLLLCLHKKSAFGYSPAIRSSLFVASHGRYASSSSSSSVHVQSSVQSSFSLSKRNASGKGERRLSRWKQRLYSSNNDNSNEYGNSDGNDTDDEDDNDIIESSVKIMHPNNNKNYKDHNNNNNNNNALATEQQQPLPGSAASAFQVQLLKQENTILRETVRQLEMENERLSETSSSSKIIIESFEREGSSSSELAWYNTIVFNNDNNNNNNNMDDVVVSSSSAAAAAQWCDDLEEGQCPVEPTVSFMDAMRDRAYWLVGLLALQSCSGFILSHNEALLERHQVIIYFLTMLVGAGGNAGNQASVRVIRGLALGTLNERTQSQFLWRELKMAAILSAILSTAGFLRAVAFATPLPETIAVTSALSLIVFTSICLGAVLPLLLKKVGVDPAHSSTTIQVVMDILGVLLTVVVSTAVLDSPVGQLLVSKLTG